MPLLAGAKLGPYEIIALIGAGGMGEVYRARDTRLGRDVAIKVSHERFSERFEREARAIAALNHPNICQIYDVGENYLVMELIDGEPIARPDSTRKLLDQAVQIADGLSAAHAAGIVHRDLKPANILITSAQSGDPGRVKILDFGLAKSAADDPAPDATRTIGITDPGTTVGTIAYMSPEQARGQTKLAPQSDQFSLGLVLYELCAGKPAFVRGSSAETMTAIIREEADPLPAAVPTPLRWVIERLLAKEPADRYDSTRDLYRELRHIRDRITETTSAREIPAAEAAKPRRRWPVSAIATAVCLIAALALAIWLTPPAQPNLSKYIFTPIAREEAPEVNPKWSPDGKSIAYNAIIHGIGQIFTKVVGAAEAVQVTHCPDYCSLRFWSPDGAAVYYLSGNNLWSVAVSGGTPELALENVSAVCLHPDGHTLIFVRDGKGWIGSLGGTEAPRPMSWQPPGKSPAWMGISRDGSKLAVVDRADLWFLSLPSGAARKVFTSGYDWEVADWFPDSRHLLLKSRSNNTSTVALLDSQDGARQTVYTTPDTVFSASISPDGKRIVLSMGTFEWDVVEVALATGAVHTMLAGGGVSWWPDWAPSGDHFLVSSNRSGGFSILDVGTNGFSRVIAGDPKESKTQPYQARWAPDGSHFLFTSADETARTAKLMLSNASGGPAIPIADLGTIAGRTYSWSPDSHWIATLRNGPRGEPQLVKVKATAGTAPVPLPNADLDLAPAYAGPEWSPSGDWILYPSKQGVALISPDGTVVRKLSPRKLSPFGFSKDGRTVYGIFNNISTAEWQLYAIDVSTGAEKVLAPVDLPASANGLAGFSVHPDGKRFLTSIAKWQYDIWMIEGFDRQPANWWSRVWRR
jgi:serine/threonine protein kinase